MSCFSVYLHFYLNVAMADFMLPASPSWYCSRVVDTNENGLLCFGAKHSIYVLDTATYPPKFRGVISAHEDRVVGLSFSTDDQQNKVCSVSEDGKVKIWNVTDGSLCAEHAEHKDKVTSVHWSPVDSDLVVSGDDKGGVITWHPTSGEIKMFSPEHNAVFCLTCSPHVASYVAVGYKNGHILLLDISKKESSSILKRFKGHDDEIHSIVWCPQISSQLLWRQPNGDDAPVSEEPEESLLASSSRDKTIRVWCLSQNKPVYFMKLPSTGQRRGWDDAKQRLWVTLYWPRHRTNELISSSFNGELLLWDLSVPGKQQSPKHFTGRNDCRAHTRIVFNLVPAGKDGTALCSISMDRNIIFWDLETLTTKHIIPSCGGSVYCLVQSPIHPGRLAAGIGDNLVRVWNVENLQKPYDVNVYWQGIKSKVTAVCWHPVKEGQLAFGTEDGKVGILDILSSRSQGSSTYHNRTVYVVTWGPPSYKRSDRNSCGVDYVLYSCGDSTVLQHNPTQLQDNALDINHVIRETNNLQGKLRGRSEISWKPDFSVVALGNEDGTIEIFKAGTLQILCSVQVHRKLVNVVRWHPEYTNENVDPSPYQFWIASGSNESVVHVTDLKKLLEVSSTGENTSPVVVTESFCQLEGHTDRITGLSWSPHCQGRLVSASYDWTAQVWDVNKSEPLANYRGHHGRMLCAVWSGLDSDLVYTGSDDFAIHCWKTSCQMHKMPPAGSEKRKHRIRNRGTKSNVRQSTQSQQTGSSVFRTITSQAEAAPVDTKSMTETELTMIQTMLNQKKEELLLQSSQDATGTALSVSLSDQVLGSPDGNHIYPTITSSTSQMVASASPLNREIGRKEVKDKKKRKTRSLFPLSSTIDNRGKLQTQDDCVHLAQAKAKDPVPLVPVELCHLGHFLNRPNSYQLFHKEIDHHLNLGNWEQYTILETFLGDIGDSVRTLTEKQELNDFTVALSAMASPTTWRATCETYATQLEKEGNYTKAATYLLAIHRVYDAIDLLQRNGHYKDAICLARVRLSPEDPVIKSLYSSWGHHLASDGNYEHAAKCYIANDQPLEAARLLARRADTSALHIASEICINSRDIANAKVYCQKYVQQCMLNLDWASAAELIQMEAELKLYGLLITTHQSLLQQLHLLGYISAMDVDQGEPYTMKNKKTTVQHSNTTALPWLLLNMSDVEGWLPWNPHTIEGEVFVLHLIRQWYCLWDLDMTRNSLERLDQELIMLSHTRQTQTAIKQVLIEVTCYITMAIIDMMLSKDDDAAKWMTVAMEICHNKNLEDVWEGLCRLLLPAGPNRFSNICHEVRALRLAAIPQENVGLDQVVVSTGQRRQSLPDQHIKRVDVKMMYNNSEACTATDCLNAFYCLMVLHYYLTKDSQKRSCTRDQPSALCIQDLAQSLLWNLQLQRLKLEDTLLQISKAMTTQSHQSIKSDMSINIPPNIDCDLEQAFEYPVTPEIKNVSLAAFHKENEMRELRLRRQLDVSDQASFHDDAPLQMVEEEFVTMKDIDIESEKNIGVDSATPDFNSTSRKQKGMFPEGAESLSSDDVSESRVTGTADMDQHEKRCQIYPNVPDDWYMLPVEEKYKQSYVDLTILTLEQAFAQNELSCVKQKLMDIPFPNPEESAMQLVRLCEMQQSEDGAISIEAIVKWAQQYCYTTNALKFFSEHAITHTV